MWMGGMRSGTVLLACVVHAHFWARHCASSRGYYQLSICFSMCFHVAGRLLWCQTLGGFCTEYFNLVTLSTLCKNDWANVAVLLLSMTVTQARLLAAVVMLKYPVVSWSPSTVAYWIVTIVVSEYRTMLGPSQYTVTVHSYTVPITEV